MATDSITNVTIFASFHTLRTASIAVREERTVNEASVDFSINALPYYASWFGLPKPQAMTILMLSHFRD